MKHSNKPATIYLVRHGETEWNVLGKVQGHSDSKLTSNGELQAKGLADKLRNVHFDHVFSSDLQRAKRTAEIIISGRTLTVRPTNILREQNFGKYEGYSKHEFLRLFVNWDRLNDTERRRYKISSDMESDEEAAARLVSFIKELGTTCQGDRVLLVSHGSILRSFLIGIGAVTYDSFKGLKNAGYIIIESDRDKFYVKQIVGCK